MKTGKSDASNSRAILQLKALTYKGFCRIDFNETPNHNHRNVQGEPKIIKISAMLITCKVYEPDKAVKVTVAPTAKTQALGFTHWNKAA